MRSARGAAGLEYFLLLEGQPSTWCGQDRATYRYCLGACLSRRWPLRLADYCKQVLEGDDELIRQARRMAASVAAGEFTSKQPADSKPEEEEEEEPGAAYLYATYRLDAKLGA